MSSTWKIRWNGGITKEYMLNSSYSLGAKFQKAASFCVRLTQKVTEVWYVHMKIALEH